MPDQALCIGINYVGTDSELFGCLNDANDWADLLEARGFAVTTLLEAAATRDAILQAIADSLMAAGRDGVCVITYSGHGSYRADGEGDEADGRDEIWCPYDFAAGAYIADDEIYDVMRLNGNGARIVMISDSCFSGTMAKAVISPLTATRHHRVRFLPPSKVLGAAEAARARLVRGKPRSVRPDLCALLSGCSDSEYSYDGEFEGRSNGAFTYCALQALRVLDTSSTYSDWVEVIRRYLPSSSYPQTPGIQGTPEQRTQIVFSRADRAPSPRAPTNEGRRGYASARHIPLSAKDV